LSGEVKTKTGLFFFGTHPSASLLISSYFFSQEKHSCQASVAHTYNPSYSGGRDQKDHGWVF
jgi:hypothetical protein